MKNQYQHAGYPAESNIQLCTAHFGVVSYFKSLLLFQYRFLFLLLKNKNVERSSKISASVSIVSGICNLHPDLSVIGLKMVKI
jgi:hypothetical protein